MTTTKPNLEPSATPSAVPSAVLALAPLRNLVLLRPAPSTQCRSGLRADGSTYDLLVPASAQHEEPLGTVLACGPDCKHCHPGMVVLYDPSACIRADANNVVAIGRAAQGNAGYNANARLLCPEADILAIIER